MGSILLYSFESSSPLSVFEIQFKPERASILKNADKSTLNDYTDVTQYEDGFIAVGSNGRIDRISKAGEIISYLKVDGIALNCVLVDKGQIYAAGANGNLLVSSGKGEFVKIDCATVKNINTLTWFDNKVIAGADGGEISVGNESGLFKTTQLDLNGNIVSISANATDCYGVTDKGEIIHSNDGINWSVVDFNKAYEGFYQTCQFTKVLATEKQISIIGKQDDGMPVMFYSSRGTVWAQRNLEYVDKKGVPSLLQDIPNDIYYDVVLDQYILICNHGKMMTIPSCSHCNKLFEVSTENLKSIAGNENSLIIVGENGFLKAESMDYF